MDDEVGGVAPITDEQVEKLELSFGYSDDDYESLVNAFRNAWPSIICRLRSQSAEIAELRHLRDGLMAASNNAAAEIAELRRRVDPRVSQLFNDLENANAMVSHFREELELLRQYSYSPQQHEELMEATRAELAEARRTIQAFVDAPAAQMSVGAGRLLPINSEGMRTLVDELAEAKRENLKLAAGQCLHELKGDEFGNAYCSRIHELEAELSEAKAQRRGAWKSGRDRERQNAIDLRNKLADCERERDTLRADLERASEKIEKQNAALLRVYTLEDENNALKADLERVKAQRNACERALAERDGQRRNDG